MTEITAQIILRATDGSSLLESTTPPTGEELARRRPTQDSIENVTRTLASLGFQVGEVGAVGITVTADKATFERVFETSLAHGADPETGAARWAAEVPITIGDELRPWVADVVFPIAPEFVP